MRVQVKPGYVRCYQVAPIPDDTSVPKIVMRRAQDRPGEIIVEECVSNTSEGQEWRPIAVKDFAEDIRRLGAYFVSLGVAAGDRVLVLGQASFMWGLVDLALQAINAVSVPIYETDSASQIRAIAEGTDPVLGVADTEERAFELSAASGQESVTFAECARYRAGAATGPALSRSALATVARRMAEQRGKDVATIVYTSGTTGSPRGVPLTHRNLAGALAQQLEFFPQAIRDADVRGLLFLPMAHIFSRTAGFMMLGGYGRGGHAPSMAELTRTFAQFHPTTIGAVPRVLEKIYDGARAKAHGPLTSRIFGWAERQAVRRAPYIRSNRRVPLRVAAPYAVAHRLVFHTLEKAMGGRLRCVVSGGASLAEEVDNFFTGIGLRIYGGYGLTESSGGCVCNTPEATKLGTVGRPLPGYEAALGEDGELLLKGVGIFSGYYQNEEATREAFTEDGWFRTGDLADIDADGFITILGRKKDIIITAGGKNVQPGPVEDRLRRHPLISQAVMVGEGKRFVGALITLDAENLGHWLDDHGLPHLSPSEAARHPAVTGDIAEAIARENHRVSRAESIRRFLIVEGDFTEDNGLLTPSLKIKRAAVERAYARDVTALYSTAADPRVVDVRAALA